MSDTNMKKPAFILLLFCRLAFGIDNPEAPEYVAEFEKRIKPLYTYVTEKATSTSDYIHGYAAIEKALDNELNIAYQKLISKLDIPRQQLLKESQRAWLKYRDLEFNFIEGNWTVETFGTSSAISRGDYRATILKNRVIELLWYLQNYP